jgi:hypothetical protein
MKQIAFILALLAAAGTAGAQTSDHFDLSEYTFNAGGHPDDNGVLSSTHFTMTLDSLGAEIVAAGMSSASFTMDAGFASAYPPPGETAGLIFLDHETLQWNAEKSAGVYNLYRDLMSNLSGLGYGDCQQQDIQGTSTSDGGTPPLENGWFYLVTAENRVGEEGTKGYDGNGGERPNPAPCP